MGRILVVGLGRDERDLTVAALEALRGARRVVLRTGVHGCAAYLSRQGIGFETLDGLYDTCEDFDQLNDSAARTVLSMAEAGPLLYGVADLRDETVVRLIELSPEGVELLPGVPVDGALTGRTGTNYRALAAADWEAFHPDARIATLVREMDDRAQVSELKLRLMERYPEEHVVWVLEDGGALRRMALCELDRLECYSHRVCALIPQVGQLTQLERYGFEQLTEIMRQLCGHDGCPWDREQTHESLKPYLLEESYEVLEAIDQEDYEALPDELGDVLLQVAFHAEVGRQHGEFDIEDVTSAICQKMIERHPHVFGSARAESAQEVRGLWERIKRETRQETTCAQSMRSIARSLPALMRAAKVQKKAAAVGFDWDDARAALTKVNEEVREVEEALDQRGDLEEELGDLLFAVVNVARLAHIDSELCLDRATEKFLTRFERMERLIEGEGRQMDQMNLSEMDAYWDRVKRAPEKTNS